MTAQQIDNRTPNPPVPERHPGSGALPVSIISMLFSLLFIIYGSYVLARFAGRGLLTVFAIVIISYGLSGLVILACAYLYRTSWCVMAMVVSAVICLGVYVLALAAGVLTGLQLSGFFLLALALWCNWFAVVKVVRGGARS